MHSSKGEVKVNIAALHQPWNCKDARIPHSVPVASWSGIYLYMECVGGSHCSRGNHQ